MASELVNLPVKGPIIQDHGTAVNPPATTIDFEGAGVTVTDVNGVVTVTITGGMSTAYDTIQEEGVPLTQRTKLNFIGAAITAADDAGNTRTNVTLSQSPASASVVGTGRLISNGTGITGGGDLSADRTLSVVNNTTTQKVGISKNGAAVTGTRQQINFIEGTNVTMTVADNGGSDRVDVTINSSGGGGSGYSIIQEEGVALTARTKMNFIGAAITAADNGGTSTTDITLSQSPASASVVGTGRTLTAGTGLTGGGDLSADRTFAIDSTVATLTGSQTLQNKTIDDTNTVQLKDTLFTLEDDGDATKLMQFQLSGITTGTTRTLTVPNASTTIVGTAVAQTLSNKTLDNTNVVTVKDSNFTIQDDVDVTKQAVFQASGITTGTTRTFTFPDATTTIVGTGATQTLTNKTLDNTNTVTLKDTLFTLQDDADTTKQAVFQLSAISTATTRTITVPDSDVTLVGTSSTQTIQNKTIDNTNTITVKDNKFTLQDDGDVTKQMVFQLSGISTGTTRTVTMPDASGTVTLLGNASTGSGSVVLATSPTLVTPVLGVATATTINKVTLTQPATGSTLTIADGKTLTVNNSLTLAGSDATTITFQGTDTYVGRATTDTLTNKTLTAPKFANNGFIADANGNEEIVFTATSSAVNQMRVANAATGNAPTLSAEGDDSNVSLFLDAKGTGVIRMQQALIIDPVTLSDAATVATDASLSNTFRVTLGGNRTLGNPTNPTDGQYIKWEIIQDGTGGRTLAYDTKFAFGTDISGATLTTGASKRDFLGAVYNLAADKFYVIAFAKGY